MYHACLLSTAGVAAACEVWWELSAACCAVRCVLLQSTAFLAWLKEAEEDDSEEEDSDE
jgi:hypothetical protein